MQYLIDNLLLSTTYLGPVEYFSAILNAKKIFIEGHENYQKQTFRNRCIILGANGPIDLIIPVEKGRGKKKNIRDVRMAYDMDWHVNHWRTIFSAYNSSPFFQYYSDDIRPFYSRRWNFLFDFNLALMEKILLLLSVPQRPEVTSGFETAGPPLTSMKELSIPPGKKGRERSTFSALPYPQVFNEKFGFVPNLSIIDLLFNVGTDSSGLLRKCRGC